MEAFTRDLREKKRGGCREVQREDVATWRVEMQKEKTLY